MGRRRTFDPGEWMPIIEAAGLGCHVCGSYFLITVGGRYAPNAMGISLPRSGRVQISELTREIARAESYKKSLAA